MRVLVIGGTGFIGRPVVSALLDAGHAVGIVHRGRQVLDMPGAAPILADRNRLADATLAFEAFAPDVVIDMILSSGRQASGLMEVFRGRAGRVVVISSMDVYRACGVLHGLEAGGLEPLPLTESSALRTTRQTYASEQVQALRQVFGWVDDEYDKIPVEEAVLGDAELPGTVLRLPMVYGPGDPLRRFYPIVKRIVDGRRSLLLSESTAQWRATKGYVANVAAAIAVAATHPHSAGRTYNVGEADTLTELEWTERAARALGWNGRVAVRPDSDVPPHLRAPGNAAQHWVADTTRIREELGFQEPVARDAALEQTVAWERDTPVQGFVPHAFDYEAEDRAAPA